MDVSENIKVVDNRSLAVVCYSDQFSIRGINQGNMRKRLQACRAGDGSENIKVVNRSLGCSVLLR